MNKVFITMLLLLATSVSANEEEYDAEDVVYNCEEHEFYIEEPSGDIIDCEEYIQEEEPDDSQLETREDHEIDDTAE